MVALATLLFILLVSLIITRVATVALQRTGLSNATARFQARSAFSGTGFTTIEAEQIANHPVRRRIVSLLMLLGNVGLVSVMSTIVLSFVSADESQAWLRWGVLLGGLVVLWVAAMSKWVDQQMGRTISWALAHFTELDTTDYAHLLHISDGYGVTEVTVQPQGQLDRKSVGDSGLAEGGLLMLGIRRTDGSYEGAPAASAILSAGDVAYLYGPNETVAQYCQARAEARP